MHIILLPATVISASQLVMFGFVVDCWLLIVVTRLLQSTCQACGDLTVVPPTTWLQGGSLRNRTLLVWLAGRGRPLIKGICQPPGSASMGQQFLGKGSRWGTPLKDKRLNYTGLMKKASLDEHEDFIDECIEILFTTSAILFAVFRLSVSTPFLRVLLRIEQRGLCEVCASCVWLKGCDCDKKGEIVIERVRLLLKRWDCYRTGMM